MPLPRSAEDFIPIVRSHLEKIRTTHYNATALKRLLAAEPFEPDHYEILYTMAGLLHERTRLLLMECETQHRLITDNCEVEVLERLTHIEQPPDDPMPY